MTPADIISGYELAMEQTVQILDALVCVTISDCREEELVTKAVKTAVMSKQYGNEDFLARLITKACSKFFKYIFYIYKLDLQGFKHLIVFFESSQKRIVITRKGQESFSSSKKFSKL